MTDELELLFAPQHHTRTYRVTFADGERYLLTAVGCFGGGDVEVQAAGRVILPIVRRAEAEVHFQPGKTMSFPLRDVREVADELTGELLYAAV